VVVDLDEAERLSAEAEARLEDEPALAVAAAGQAAERLLDLAGTYGSAKYRALGLARLDRREQAARVAGPVGSDYLLAQVAPARPPEPPWTAWPPRSHRTSAPGSWNAAALLSSSPGAHQPRRPTPRTSRGRQGRASSGRAVTAAIASRRTAARSSTRPATPMVARR
jgi:hypothetical protein